MTRPPFGGYRPEKPAKADLAFTAAAVDPREGALAEWNERFGVTPPRAAKTGTSSNRRRGTAVEGTFGGKGVASLLRAEGYTVIRSHQSGGAADVVGLRASGDGPAVRAVQAKRLARFRPDGLNDAVLRFLGLGRWWREFEVADGSREAWLYVDGEGWAVRLVINAGNEISGDGPRYQEVLASVERAIERARNPKAGSDSLRERLTT